MNVPEQFLKLVCPMAEGIIELLDGMENMQGTRYFWQLAISLRPYVFQVCHSNLSNLVRSGVMTALPECSNHS